MSQTVPPNAVTCTLTPIEHAPPGVFEVTIGCAHSPASSGEFIAQHLIRVVIGGIVTYARNPSVDIDTRTPPKRMLIEGHMAHMSQHGVEFDQCACWDQWVMRHGSHHYDISGMSAFSRQ